VSVALALLLQASDVPSGVETCAAAMARRDEAFRPLAAEMAALRAKNKGLDTVIRKHDTKRLIAQSERYPSLQDSQRYVALENDLERLNRGRPYRDCQQEAAAHAPH
jgi:hypothetical protein